MPLIHDDEIKELGVCKTLRVPIVKTHVYAKMPLLRMADGKNSATVYDGVKAIDRPAMDEGSPFTKGRDKPPWWRRSGRRRVGECGEACKRRGGGKRSQRTQ